VLGILLLRKEAVKLNCVRLAPARLAAGRRSGAWSQPGRAMAGTEVTADGLRFRPKGGEEPRKVRAPRWF